MKMTSFAAALAVAVGCVAHAQAQTYPSRPVTMIVPFPAGGPTDTLARILSERMKGSLGQPVIVENVTGAGASIGVARAAQAAPDGYTLNIGNWTSHVGAGAMYPAVHDALLELQPVSRISATPLMIIGKNALPPKNAGELIAWLKARNFAPESTLFAPGQFLPPADASAIAAEIGFTRTFAYREGLAYYDGQSGAALGAFKRASDLDGATLAHVNADPEGRYAAFVARRIGG